MKKGDRISGFWVNGVWVNWVNLDGARLADETLDILRALLMILKLGLSINRTNIVPYSVIVLSNVLKVTLFSANLTYDFHFTYLQLGLTDPFGSISGYKDHLENSHNGFVL